MDEWAAIGSHYQNTQILEFDRDTSLIKVKFRVLAIALLVQLVTGNAVQSWTGLAGFCRRWFKPRFKPV